MRPLQLSCKQTFTGRYARAHTHSHTNKHIYITVCMCVHIFNIFVTDISETVLSLSYWCSRNHKIEKNLLLVLFNMRVMYCTIKYNRPVRILESFQIRIVWRELVTLNDFMYVYVCFADFEIQNLNSFNYIVLKMSARHT